MKNRHTRSRSVAIVALVAVLVTFGSSCRSEAPGPPAGTGSAAGAAPARVKPGIEVLIEKRLDLIRGKKVGLITNPSGVDAGLRSSIDRLREAEGFELVALYGPEHGARGDAQAGEYVPFYKDAASGLPVFSLYGPSMKPPAGMLTDIDAFMRSFDTTHEDKKIEPAMTKGLDVLLFDIQDVGTRVYTYQATMAYAMQACAEAGLDFIVLDRPNPIGGAAMEGPVLEYPKHSSFVGLYPYPLRFGMTMGELARLFNEKFLDKPCRLTVVPVEGWNRASYFDATGLPWVPPSPNIPTVETAVVYPGQVFIEGTNVSEGRGTNKPFEFFGAPWIDGYKLAARLNALALPGVAFREQWFTPLFSKFKGERCGGCQIHVMDRALYRPLETTLHVLAVLRELYPKDFAFHPEYFDKIMGTDRIRLALEQGTPVSEIAVSWRDELTAFEVLRKPYLLY